MRERKRGRRRRAAAPGRIWGPQFISCCPSAAAAANRMMTKLAMTAAMAAAAALHFPQAIMLPLHCAALALPGSGEGEMHREEIAIGIHNSQQTSCFGGGGGSGCIGSGRGSKSGTRGGWLQRRRPRTGKRARRQCSGCCEGAGKVTDALCSYLSICRQRRRPHHSPSLSQSQTHHRRRRRRRRRHPAGKTNFPTAKSDS